MTKYKRPLILFILFLIAFLVQYGVMPAVGLSRLGFNILFVYVIFVALFEGTYWGLGFALVFGLINDFMVGRFIGSSVFVWGICAIIAAFVGNKAHKGNYLIPILLSLVTNIVAQLLFVFIYWSIGGFSFSLEYILKGLFLSSIVTVIFSVVAYVPLYKSYYYGSLKSVDQIDFSSSDIYR